MTVIKGKMLLANTYFFSWISSVCITGDNGGIPLPPPGISRFKDLTNFAKPPIEIGTLSFFSTFDSVN